MKPGIHPDYHIVNVRLANGETVQMRSTMKGDSYTSDVDSTNHPFYTGRRQYV
ncbi:MAG: 50S ribosomal protein L31, partial [Bacteroidota bacterium]